MTELVMTFPASELPPEDYKGIRRQQREQNMTEKRAANGSLVRKG